MLRVESSLDVFEIIKKEPVLITKASATGRHKLYLPRHQHCYDVFEIQCDTSKVSFSRWISGRPQSVTSLGYVGNLFPKICLTISSRHITKDEVLQAVMRLYHSPFEAKAIEKVKSNRLNPFVDEQHQFNENEQCSQFGLIIRESANGDCWYGDSEGIAPAMCYPKHWCDDWAEVEQKYVRKWGSTLVVSNQNDEWVELTKKESPYFTSEKAHLLLQINRALQAYTSFIPSLIISEKTVLSPYAGLDIEKDILEVGGFERISLCQFHQLTKELAKLHGQGIFHRDISAANLVIESEGAQLKLIDLETMYIPRVSGKVNVLGTAYCMTADILTAVEEDDCNSDVLRCKDDFALLTVMIRVTAQQRLSEQVTKFSANKKTCLMNDCKGDIKSLLQHWIECHVLPYYQQPIKDFLSSPLSNPLSQPLFNMMNWVAT